MQDTSHEFIDTHAHLVFEPLINDIGAVLQRSIDAGVTRWITVGTNTEENGKTLKLIEKHEGMYAAVGIHPHFAKDVTDADLAELEKAANHEKVVAIGETGLDFHYNFSKQPAQKQLFGKQLALEPLDLLRLDLPVIVHCREAFDETMAILQPFTHDIKKVVFHCFTGSSDQTQAILQQGWHISFTGVVTFKNATKLLESAAIVPSDRMMLETDCPYMSPEPMRKQKVNEPALMIHTAKYLAELKHLSLADLSAQTLATTKEFFSLS